MDKCQMIQNRHFDIMLNHQCFNLLPWQAFGTCPSFWTTSSKTKMYQTKQPCCHLLALYIITESTVNELSQAHRGHVRLHVMLEWNASIQMRPRQSGSPLFRQALMAWEVMLIIQISVMCIHKQLLSHLVVFTKTHWFYCIYERIYP